jgi:outer membrane lipoprotein-sorting protein
MRRLVIEKMNNVLLYFATACVLLSFCNTACADTVEEEISRIQTAYEKLSDLKGSFVQKSHIKDLRRTDTYKGQFFIKRPMKMKWEYRGEKAQEIYISNDRITIYQKKEKQAFSGKFDRNTYGQSPIALLGGFGKIQEEFSVTSKDGNLILKPKTPMKGIISIEIEPSDGEFPISSLTIRDSYSNRIEIRLKDITINSGLKEGLFEPSLPKDVNVYDNP